MLAGGGPLDCLSEMLAIPKHVGGTDVWECGSCVPETDHQHSCSRGDRERLRVIGDRASGKIAEHEARRTILQGNGLIHMSGHTQGRRGTHDGGTGGGIGHRNDVIQRVGEADVCDRQCRGFGAGDAVAISQIGVRSAAARCSRRPLIGEWL